MKSVEIKEQIKKLESLDAGTMYQNDFLLTWDHSDDEIAAVFQTAEILRWLRGQNISSRGV